LGIGAASFHVGDWAWVSSITNPSQAAGFFTAPGVTSLAIRGLLGWSEQAFLFSCIQLGDYCQIYQQWQLV